MLKINTMLPLHSRKQNYTLHLANGALKKSESQCRLEGTSGWHLVKPTDQRKVNCKVKLALSRALSCKFVRMQIHWLSEHIVPFSLWKINFVLFCFIAAWRKVGNFSVEWEQSYIVQMNWQQQNQTHLKAFPGTPVVPEKDLFSFILHLQGMGKRGSREVRPSVRLLCWANTQCCVVDF